MISISLLLLLQTKYRNYCKLTLFLRANFLVLFIAVNNVVLLGRVGAEPQKRGSTEHPVIIFSLATHTNYKYGTGNTVDI